MSKFIITFARPAVFLGIFLQSLNIGLAQVTETVVKIEAGTSKVRVEGHFQDGSRSKKLSFLLARGGIVGLGGRISDVTVSNGGQKIELRRFSDGEYLTDLDFDTWYYTVDLTPAVPAHAAHISWLSDDRGVLMTDDLLPQVAGAGGRIRFELPEGWKVVGGGEFKNNGWYEFADAERALFVMGKGWRGVEGPTEKPQLALDGHWLFTDEEAAAMTAEVFEEYRKLFGAKPASKSQIVISRFPVNVGSGTWEAETRGETVLIMSSDMPFRTQSLQRLHEQLRHELFHLWLPNGVKLNGNYDWFYEGFAMYQSLKLAVSLNRIRFEDYLDTLSRARFIAEAVSEKRSLVDASKERFAGSETQLYARGLATAFLCDIAMLDASGGKRSVADILRTVYLKYRNTEADGTDAVTGVMSGFAELRPIVERHVKGAERIDWPSWLSKAGIELRPDGTAIFVSAKPSRRRKDLLDQLGYNNWRKLSSPSR